MAAASFQERKVAVMQLRKGKTMQEVASIMGRSLFWVSKWQARFEAEGWAGLQDRSRAPKKHGKQLSTEIQDAICQTRLELEVEAALETGLRYVGSQAIRTRLQRNGIHPLPSISSIERILRARELVRQKTEKPTSEIIYPHLRPTGPHQLCQVDIVPHFLQGGQRVSCFNAIDVVSRYPTGQAFKQRRALDACAFLIHVWQEMGIAHYTQVDNEGCFSGGGTHQYVLGKVVRLALTVGTELLFSPVRHPQSNGYIERFHQDYNRHVWQDTYLEDLATVNQRAHWFFNLYRDRLDHSQLNGQSPRHLHQQLKRCQLPQDFALATPKLPLREGRVHFMRRVHDKGQVRVLNVLWPVPEHDVSQGVWVTIAFQLTGATLSIFDQAPDATSRHCLAAYPFPLTEPVLPQDTLVADFEPSPLEQTERAASDNTIAGASEHKAPEHALLEQMKKTGAGKPRVEETALFTAC